VPKRSEAEGVLGEGKSRVVAPPLPSEGGKAGKKADAQAAEERAAATARSNAAARYAVSCEPDAGERKARDARAAPRATGAAPKREHGAGAEGTRPKDARDAAKRAEEANDPLADVVNRAADAAAKKGSAAAAKASSALASAGSAGNAAAGKKAEGTAPAKAGAAKAADLKAMVAEREALRAQLNAYEAEFVRTRGRAVLEREDIAPIAAAYKRYRELRDTLREHAAAHVLAE
jgi:hypothetical protein